MQTGPSESLGAAFLRRRQVILLLAIVCALAARPLMGDSGAAPIVFSVALLLVLLLALLTIRVDELRGERSVLLAQRRHRSIIAWALAVPAIAERLYMIISPSPRVLLLGTITWLLFFCFVTWSQVRTLLRHKQITGETISMSISIYMLLGLTWALLYVVILELQPGAFRFGDENLVITNPTGANVLPMLVYFSFTTLSTTGFGDIVPATLASRYAAIAESITGQFYLAILVARLVGMQMSRRSATEA